MGTTDRGHGVVVECLTCNAQDTAESADAAGLDGGWRCPECGGDVGLPSDPNNSTAGP